MIILHVVGTGWQCFFYFSVIGGLLRKLFMLSGMAGSRVRLWLHIVIMVIGVYCVGHLLTNASFKMIHPALSHTLKV